MPDSSPHPSDASSVAIVRFRPEFRAAFDALNRAWLVANDLLEPADIEYLEDPEGKILNAGGEIFVAVESGRVLGTCALFPIGSGAFELAKLGVLPEAHGRGLGKLLCRAVIDEARRKGAYRIELTSNSRLVHALRLYESLGFRRQPMPADVRYQSADVYMTLAL